MFNICLLYEVVNIVLYNSCISLSLELGALNRYNMKAES